MVFLIESVATTTLLSASVYLLMLVFNSAVRVLDVTHDTSISPSKRTQTVISTTVCTLLVGSRWTLYKRTLSLP